MTIQRIPHHAHWGAFTALVEDGRVVGAEPFRNDPYASPMLSTIPDLVYSDSRVLHPHVRKGWLEKGPDGDRTKRGAEPFVRVPWDEALDMVAAELRRVKERHGNESIFGGSYGWSSAGRFHHARSQVRRFLYGFGGCTDQVTNYSWGAAMVLLPHILGDFGAADGKVTSWRNISANTKLMVLFGGASLKNGQVASGGAGENAYEKWLRKAAASGVTFVNISPVKDDGPDFLNAAWIPIRPSTDTAMMLALAHTLVAEGLHDAAFCARYCAGTDRFIAYLKGETDGQPKDAAWAAAITGVDADTIRDLARRMAAQRTMLSAAWSLQRAHRGEQPFWALIALACLLGQIGLPGGGFGFGYGSINGIGIPRRQTPSPSLPMGRNPTGLAIPVARITDMLLNPGATLEFNGTAMTYPDIRMIYWAGGNPFHHHQDLNRLLKGWQKPETVVVHEPWWTATARHADIVLPATMTLERNDVGAASRDRFIFAMHKAIEPLGESRNDFDIFSALAERLDFRDAFTEGRDEQAWLRQLYDLTGGRERNVDFETFWEQGYIEIPEPEEDEILLSHFRDDPERYRLPTPTGKIEVFSETVAKFGYDDCPGYPVWLEPAEWLGGERAKRFPLHLVSNQPKTRLHGQTDQAHVSRASKVAGREPAQINTADAAARGIGTGDVIRVFNQRGACLAGAVVTDGVMPGVIQLSSGAWFDPAEPGRPGSLERHGNPNVLTLDAGTSRLGQGPTSLTALVEIEKATETPEAHPWGQPATVPRNQILAK
ncbi:MAG: molybdopterin-dependent oxidoreductase [Acetobacterales bacterium]